MTQLKPLSLNEMDGLARWQLATQGATAARDLVAAGMHPSQALVNAINLPNSEEIIRVLVAELGASVSRSFVVPGSTRPGERIPLFSAAQCNCIPAASALIDLGANINQKSSKAGATSLWIAAEEGHTEMCRFLLRSGADLEIPKGDTRTTALWIASQQGNMETCLELLRHGADPNAVNRGGCPPASIAAFTGKMACVALLLRHGGGFMSPTLGLGGLRPLAETFQGAYTQMSLVLGRFTAADTDVGAEQALQWLSWHLLFAAFRIVSPEEFMAPIFLMLAKYSHNHSDDELEGEAVTLIARLQASAEILIEKIEGRALDSFRDTAVRRKAALLMRLHVCGPFATSTVMLTFGDMWGRSINAEKEGKMSEALSAAVALRRAFDTTKVPYDRCPEMLEAMKLQTDLDIERLMAFTFKLAGSASRASLWQRHTPIEGDPLPRPLQFASYAQHLGKVYRFGGCPFIVSGSDVSSSNFWAFDLRTRQWEEVPSPALPPGHSVHAAPACGLAYHSSVVTEGAMWVFGGCNNTIMSRAEHFSSNLFRLPLPPSAATSVDSHSWEWEVISSRGAAQQARPCGRGGHACCLYLGKMYIHGGETKDGTYLNDLWELDFSNLEWTRLSPGSKSRQGRRHHAIWAAHGVLYIYGGSVPREHNLTSDQLETFTLSSKTWEAVSALGDHPGPAQEMCVLPLFAAGQPNEPNSALLIGGYSDISAVRRHLKHHPASEDDFTGPYRRALFRFDVATQVFVRLVVLPVRQVPPMAQGFAVQLSEGSVLLGDTYGLGAHPERVSPGDAYKSFTDQLTSMRIPVTPAVRAAWEKNGGVASAGMQASASIDTFTISLPQPDLGESANTLPVTTVITTSERHPGSHTAHLIQSSPISPSTKFAPGLYNPSAFTPGLHGCLTVQVSAAIPVKDQPQKVTIAMDNYNGPVSDEAMQMLRSCGQEASPRNWVVADAGLGGKASNSWAKWVAEIRSRDLPTAQAHYKSLKGTNANSGQWYRLRVEIDGLSPAPWRQILVAGSVTLAQLHDQILCPTIGWARNHHAYAFRRGLPTPKQLSDSGVEDTDKELLRLFQLQAGEPWIGPTDSTALDAVMLMPLYIGGAVANDRKVKLENLQLTTGDSLHYVYDFGCWWSHTIVVEDICSRPVSLDGKEALSLPAELLDGGGACPPENIGGPEAYSMRVQELLGRAHKDGVLLTPSTEAFWEVLRSDFWEQPNWRGGCRADGFDPAAFCIDEARQRLRDALRSPMSIASEADRNSVGESSVSKSVGCTAKPAVVEGESCPICGTTAGLQACSRCRKVKYCSHEHQKAHWKAHKKTCKQSKK